MAKIRIYLTKTSIEDSKTDAVKRKMFFQTTLMFPVFPAEFGRGKTGIALEGAAETVNIGISAPDRDLTDRQIGVFDEFAGMETAQTMEEFAERNAVELTPDLQTEMRFGNLQHFRQVLDAERTVVILPDQFEQFIHERTVERNDRDILFGLAQFSAQEQPEGIDCVFRLITGMFLIGADYGLQQREIFRVDRKWPVHQRKQGRPAVAAVTETYGQEKPFRTRPAQIEIMDLKGEYDHAVPGRDLEPHVVQSEEGGGAEIAFDLITLMIAFIGYRPYPGR